MIRRMQTLFRHALLAGGLAALGAQTAHAAPPADTVNVTGGAIAGARADGMRLFFGVPFAAPPVGELRWRPPQPVVPWTVTKEARHFAPACAQTAVWITQPKSEDCLYLNIWAPEDSKGLPVIVWIHGGGYYGGAASQAEYDGVNLARRGVIVVTVNYRLGIFGFFSHPDLAAESKTHTSGNQGIEDQIAALHWVRTNIAAFGGNADNVTIMGESAGGESVAILVASPLATGLFQRAIAESGNDAMPIDPAENSLYDRQTADAQGRAFAQAVGAADLASLRKASVATLQKPAWSPHPIVDGHVLQTDLTTTYRAHRQNDVPVLLGWNAEEGKDLAPELLDTDKFTAAAHAGLVAKLLGHVPSKAVLDAYPGATDAQAHAAIEQLTNDWWGWRMWTWAGLQANHGRAPAYLYYFAHRPTTPTTPCGYGCGAGHGAEIRYVFDHLDQDPRPWSAQDRQLAAQMASTWANFARTGNPNGGGLPAWSRFDGSSGSILRIGGADDLQARGKLPDFSLFGPPPKP